MKKNITLSIIILLLGFWGSCKKKSKEIISPIVVQDTTGLSGLNNQLKGDWRFVDFDGSFIFKNPKNGLKSIPISIKEMLDSFKSKFGNEMDGDSLTFIKNSALGGLVYGVSHLVVYCPYGTSGNADGAYTTYKMVNEASINKVQIQWTYWKKNGSNFDTTHVVPYHLPLAKYTANSLEIAMNQSDFLQYSIGTEQLGSNIIVLLFSLTNNSEYTRIGFDTYTKDDYKTYASQMFEVNSTIQIKMSKIR